MGTDVAYRSAVELANDIAGHRVSPVEIMEETLRRIEVREPSLNAIVYRGFDEAMESARSAEEALAKGAVGRSSPGCAGSHEGPLRLQTGVAGDIRGHPGDVRLLDRWLLRLGGADGSRRRHHHREGQQPGHGLQGSL